MPLHVFGEGNDNPVSTLAWKIPWMEEPGRLQSMGSQIVGHNWVPSLHFSTFYLHNDKIMGKKYQKSLATLRSTVDSCCIGFADSIKWGWLQGARVGGGGGRTGSQEVCNFIDLPTWPRWDPSPGTVRKGTSAISLRAFLFCLEVNYFPFGKLVNIKRWLEWRDWTMQIRDW